MRKLFVSTLVGLLAFAAPALAADGWGKPGNCWDVTPAQVINMANQSFPMISQDAKVITIVDARSVSLYCSVVMTTTYKRGRLWYWVWTDDVGRPIIHSEFTFLGDLVNKCRGNIETGNAPLCQNNEVGIFQP